MEYEYRLLVDKGIGGELKVGEFVKNYNGHVIVMEDMGGIILTDSPVFEGIRQGRRDVSSDVLRWILMIFIQMVECVDRVHTGNLIHMM